jgi:hypothetical protein
VPPCATAVRGHSQGLSGEGAYHSVHRPEIQIDGALANFTTVRGAFFDRLSEVEPNKDSRIGILHRGLGEAGVRAAHEGQIATGAATGSRPKSRAFSQRSSPLLLEAVLAMRLHFNGELSYQERAISVWSAVRALGVVMPSPPSDFTSL